jgi:hypothetical protein
MALQESQPDHEYCSSCGALAAGKCASCRAPVCADCTDLVSGAVRTFAVCHRCKGAPSLARAWGALLWPILALVAAGAVAVVVAVMRGVALS